ncbi:MAG: transcription-repair coupling factor [Anaerolineales bacterium]|nr:transcription-repair coupling factor [Anaerolineales bacterium]
MALNELLRRFKLLPEYLQLLDSLDELPVFSSLFAPRAIRPLLIAALHEDGNRPVLVITNRKERFLTLNEETAVWTEQPVHTFPEPNPLFYQKSGWGPRTQQARSSVLAFLAANRQPGIPEIESDPVLVLASARALMTRTISPRQFLTNSRVLKTGMQMPLDNLVRLLVDTGYLPASLVTETGQFSRRGGILDIWPPAAPLPVRIDFFGDEIDSLRYFEPATQRSQETISWIHITPAREALPKLYNERWDPLLPSGNDVEESREELLEYFLPLMNRGSHSLLDFLPDNSLIIIDDLTVFKETVSEIEEQMLTTRAEAQLEDNLPQDFPRPHLTLDDLLESLSSHRSLDLGLMGEDSNILTPMKDLFIPGLRFGGQLKVFLDHLGNLRAQHESAVILSRQAPRLVELWQEVDPDARVSPAVPTDFLPGDTCFLQGSLAEGWTLRHSESAPLHLLTDSEIFGWARPRPRIRPRKIAAAPESAYADLDQGDYIVHVEYGIGLFQGLVEKTFEGVTREYLQLAFDENSQVFVPIHQADRITRYIGADGKPPSLSRLGTPQWETAKQKAMQAVQEIAEDLLDLYARRMKVPGFAFSPDTAWQQELEASFPYIETEDQIHALTEVKADMEQPRPMDRLICGDVGYGKTEVALRASFKAVMDGKQVAMLVPTTVLAQQHLDTFRQRLAAFPVKVEMLSRFRSPREAAKIIKQAAAGEIDILIGTHRLLQKDIFFKDLGLLVIDEEQRFGVTHKEHLKSLRTEVDVLTLTATPIPRTLYFALTGVRDISTINTPPEERLPVFTHVGNYDPRLVRQAIFRELDREGQVFFVHNRVRTIRAVENQLKRLVPDARFAIAHGQMPEGELSEVMSRFAAHDIDVLVSTSIIESGLDIPNANTLIVDRADRFGLSQLYQLRGRVGRGAVRGYAYFFRHPRFAPTEDGTLRLETIATHTQLGSGFQIAMRDLEIRGAGDILGIRQHGHISAIGFHLYTRMLANAVHEIRGEDRFNMLDSARFPALPEPLPASIDLNIPASIPAEYISDRALRLQLYRRLAQIQSLETVQELEEEILDRFGKPPEEVINLLYQLDLKIIAAQAEVRKVASHQKRILLELSPYWQGKTIPETGIPSSRRKQQLWFDPANHHNWQQALKNLLLSLAHGVTAAENM